MIPSGFMALLAGWFVTEIGRQPWTAYGVIRTTESVSPAIIGPQVAWSLMAFIVLYTIIFAAGVYYILKIIHKGLGDSQRDEFYYKHGIEASALALITPKGTQDV